MTRFFTYGDLPLENHLKQIQEEALCKFDRINPNTEVPSQPHWSSPVSIQPCSVFGFFDIEYCIKSSDVIVCFNFFFFQREDHVTCSPDALAPDPAKQNTLCMSYLLGE